LSAFKDFSDAITSGALDLAWNIHGVFFIAPTPPSPLSSVVSPALPLGLPVVKDLVVIVVRFPVALFFTDYGRSNFVVITFPLVTHGALIAAHGTLTLFSFRLSGSFYSRLLNFSASLPGRRWHGLLDYRLLYCRVLNGRRRRASNRSLHDAAIPVNAYRQSRRDADADGSQNDQGEQHWALPERLLNACPVPAMLHT
jgi:hypothetical protein